VTGLPNVIVIDHPVVQTKLTELRDFTADHRKFRALLDEIASLMVYEVTRQWPTTARPVQTPMERTTGRVLARRVTLVPILRAGLGMADGVLRLLPEARLGHFGVYRDEATLTPVSYYRKLPPDVADTEVLLIDPMLATGGSAVAALDLLRVAGATDIRMICIVAAPEGIALVERHHPNVHIYTPVVDLGLNAHKFIVPGLGDFGDRLYGTA
jgi:uracil phosphoribosyltransferase